MKQFETELKKENVTDKTVKLVNDDGYSFLHESLWQSKSPNTIRAILDKGGEFTGYSDNSPNEIMDILLERVTSDYEYQLSQPNGEQKAKNDLENMTTLLDRGLVDVPVNLDKLLSNPELFEKYPDIMKKMFSYDKNLLKKLEDVKSRRENKEQNKDYLQDKLKEVRAAVKNAQRRPRKGDERKQLSPNYRIGETGEVTRKNLAEEDRPSKEKIEYGTQIQTEAAKKAIIRHDPEKLEIIRRRRGNQGK